MTVVERTRLRLRYEKLGRVRWISHRDTARVWERALRRADVPVALSEGFSPRPKISFGLALPTGHEGCAEYLDLVLDAGDDVDVAALPARLTEVLPVGFACTAAAAVERSEPSLQEAVTSAEWEVALLGADTDDVRTRLDAALGADELLAPHHRKGEEVTADIRPAILAAVIVHGDDGPVLRTELATTPRGVRPSELLHALGLGDLHAPTRRLCQWIERDGHRREPLAPRPAPHAERRAS